MSNKVTEKKDKDIVLQGKQYALIPFKVEHISDRYIGWLNDPKVNRFLAVRFVHQDRQTVTPYVQSFYEDTEKYMWGIYPVGMSEPIGTATLYDINRTDGVGEIGILIGDEAYWGKKVSEEVMLLVIRFGFNDLGLHRLTGGSHAANLGMNFTFKRLGFRCGKKFAKTFALNPGQGIDSYCWALLKEEWKNSV